MMRPYSAGGSPGPRVDRGHSQWYYSRRDSQPRGYHLGQERSHAAGGGGLLGGWMDGHVLTM